MENSSTDTRALSSAGEGGEGIGDTRCFGRNAVSNKPEWNHPANCVFVVEDDPSMRNTLKNLLRSIGLNPQLFASAEEFLYADRPDHPSCLILDVRLPGLGGLDLQTHLVAKTSPFQSLYDCARRHCNVSPRHPGRRRWRS